MNIYEQRFKESRIAYYAKLAEAKEECSRRKSEADKEYQSRIEQLRIEHEQERAKIGEEYGRSLAEAKAKRDKTRGMYGAMAAIAKACKAAGLDQMSFTLGSEGVRARVTFEEYPPQSEHQ